jgi:hypothetical protein
LRIRYNKVMASTTRGITYPTSGDNIAPLETHFASLAETTDTAISEVEDTIADVDADLQSFKLQAAAPSKGTFAFVGPANTTTAVNIVVTFPPGYFSTAPIVVVTISGPDTASPYTASVHTVTTSQFQAKIVRISGSTAQNLSLNWIALV